MNHDLQALFRSWDLSAGLHTLPPPATEQELVQAELKLGWHLPTALRALYLYSNGPDLLDGNLRIYSLEHSSGYGLTTVSSELRGCSYQIPDEVLIFSDNGSDDHFGIWLPETHSEIFKLPIVQVGEIFKPQSMAVAATDLVPFLFGWTAYYLMLGDADPAALDALGLPERLRYQSSQMDDYDVFPELLEWADPQLPDKNPDPYSRGYDSEGLKSLFARFSQG